MFPHKCLQFSHYFTSIFNKKSSKQYIFSFVILAWGMLRVFEPAVGWLHRLAVINTRENLGARKHLSFSSRQTSFEWRRNVSETGGSSSIISSLKTRPLFASSWRVRRWQLALRLVYLATTNRYETCFNILFVAERALWIEFAFHVDCVLLNPRITRVLKIPCAFCIPRS